MQASTPYRLTHGLVNGPIRQQTTNTSTPVKLEQGLSAYQIAVKNGFVGTEAAWLISLRAEGGIIWDQSTPAATWTIQHSLGRNPDVTVYVDDEQVFTDVEATSTHVVIVFPYPRAGVAILL